MFNASNLLKYIKKDETWSYRDKNSICVECGCVFNVYYAQKYKEKNKEKNIVVCPACKHEYELPK